MSKICKKGYIEMTKKDAGFRHIFLNVVWIIIPLRVCLWKTDYLRIRFTPLSQSHLITDEIPTPVSRPKLWLESNSYKAIFIAFRVRTLSDNFWWKSYVLFGLVPLVTGNEDVTSIYAKTLGFSYFARSTYVTLA